MMNLFAICATLAALVLTTILVANKLFAKRNKSSTTKYQRTSDDKYLFTSTAGSNNYNLLNEFMQNSQATVSSATI